MTTEDETKMVPPEIGEIVETDDGSMEALLDAWQKSAMIALPSQNLQLAEESYTRAFAISEHLKAHLDGDERDFVDLIYLQVALVKEILSHVFFMMEQRVDKAKESISKCSQYAEKSMALYSNLSETEITKDEEINFLLNMFALNAKFFKHLTDFQRSEMDLAARLAENKYVDELSEREKSIATLKKYFEEPWSDYNNDLYHMHSAFIKRIIDAQERKLEVAKKEFGKITYSRPRGNEVFIVHGHGEAILLELKQMLKEAFEVNPIILREQNEDGSTIIEKFESLAVRTSFVFVLLTPDDFVSNGDNEYYQGRPNVLFELGWFFGRLGREKVRILKQKNTSIPSDLTGIITIDFNEKIEEVFRKISSSLESAGILEKP